MVGTPSSPVTLTYATIRWGAQFPDRSEWGDGRGIWLAVRDAGQLGAECAIRFCGADDQHAVFCRLLLLPYAGGYIQTWTQESMSYNVSGQLGSLDWVRLRLGAAAGIQYNYSATQNNGQIRRRGYALDQ